MPDDGSASKQLLSETDDGESAVWRRFSLHDFLVDFLGGLVPGVLFLALASMSSLPPIVAVGHLIDGDTQPLQIGLSLAQVLQATKDTPSAIWIGLFIVVLMLSYVVGVAFYRRDPKIPDIESLNLLLRRETRQRTTRARLRSTQGLPRLARLRVRLAWNRMILAAYLETGPSETWMKAEDGIVPPALKGLWYWVPARWITEARSAWLKLHHDERSALEETLVTAHAAQRDHACCHASECEFPYTHLVKYLQARGHYHLLKTAREWTVRSKTHINRIKIRLAYKQPGKFRPIVRNEAHVRLATTTWYMAKALASLARWSAAPLIAMVLYAAAIDTIAWSAVGPWLYPSLMPTAVVFIASYMSRKSCEEVIHYQRLREAFHVLELAYTATHPSEGILDMPVEAD